MKKLNKTQLLLTSLVCLAPIILALVLWNKLPEQLPIHFNAAGEIDNYASKALTCFGLPAMLLFFNLLLFFGINSDPKKGNANGVIISIAIWICPVMSLIIMPITLFKGMGYDIPVEIILPAMIGVLFIIIGNYLPKSHQSYTVGIKLPWTLNDEENWNKTHRFAGFVWVIGGLLMLVSAFTGARMLVTLVVIAALVLLPLIYSYLLYRKKSAENK